jgi:hypothetical protein
MNRDLIQQRIQQYRADKETILPLIKKLFKKLQKYHQIKEKYIKYCKKYEALDREEKLHIFYSI